MAESSGGSGFWSQLFDKATGGMFGGKEAKDNAKKSPEELNPQNKGMEKEHQKSEEDHLLDSSENTHAHEGMHPILKNIMAQLSEKNAEAPTGGKGRYMGMKKA